ncbi:hypothetical protein [Pseudonocardia sp. KRD291]|uniref:hypothetical protein n=1 Tax=Pseudonocardia sp. KRD291 TaxID=2792007 RepID=UPI001C49DF30|nr:hypothetical protein [Pseudonocardia sp. KRD291]MBW0100901.1 hypothetical protein [Pseudonocardia sp. KRD291]
MRLRANHSQGHLARGGLLTVTPGLLLFEPHHYEQRLGGATVQLSANEVTGIEVAPRALRRPLSGGLRRRLRITTAESSVHLFIVSGVERVVARVNDVLRRS